MAELVTIPISTFEITIDYETPSIQLWVDRTPLIEGLFQAFKPWDLSVDDIDVMDQGE